MIKQIHVIDCDSTQNVLKEQLNGATDGETILISCENQFMGRGRGDNSWTAMPGTLCFSMNVKANPELSFTALEISVLVAKYFESKGRMIKLKWPNDLWDENEKKCGGILIQGSHQTLLAGIGLNLYSDSIEFGGVYEAAFAISKKEWALDISEYILHHRIVNKEELKREWLKRCGHLNQFVKVTEGSETFEGMFQGIGEFGEALVCTDSKINYIYNGTLRINS